MVENWIKNIKDSYAEHLIVGLEKQRKYVRFFLATKKDTTLIANHVRQHLQLDSHELIMKDSISYVENWHNN